MKNRKIYILLSLIGVLMPILFSSLIIILGALQPGFNQMTTLLSNLGGVGGIRGDLFNIGVGITGGFIVLFSIGLNRVVNQNEAGLKRVFLFILGGLGLIGTGIFNCNQNCVIVFNLDPIRSLHGIFAFIAGLSLTFAPLQLYSHFKKDPEWEKLATFTLTIVILSVIFTILFWIMFVTKILPSILGLIQKLEFLFVLIWISVISMKLLLASIRNSNKTT